MTASTQESASRIFLNYRRDDAAWPTGWLFDRLVEHFGDGQVFKDVDSIELGDDFVQKITGAVASCAVVLTVIGKRWLTVTGEQGHRRLDDPEDFVRVEIEAAFARGVRVIPVLVDGAQMPDKADLPATLAQLANRQALELTPSRFGADTTRLLEVLDKTLREAGVAPTEPLASPGRRPARDTSPPPPPPPPQPVPPQPNGGARPAARRNIAGYGRFWIGLLFAASGLICFAAGVPHTVGYGPAVSIANADAYTAAALAVLIVLGVLLLASAGISAGRTARAPRGQR
jgi:hypothetical protein